MEPAGVSCNRRDRLVRPLLAGGQGRRAVRLRDMYVAVQRGPLELVAGPLPDEQDLPAKRWSASPKRPLRRVIKSCSTKNGLRNSQRRTEQALFYWEGLPLKHSTSLA